MSEENPMIIKLTTESLPQPLDEDVSKLQDKLQDKEIIDLSEAPKQADFLNKKIKREKKLINKDLCEICLDGGDLILCDNCPKSFHLECLKLKKDDILDEKWYCPTCKPKMMKKNHKDNDEESRRKRLIKNEKRRLWRLKKKAQNANGKILIPKSLGNEKNLLEQFVNMAGSKNITSYFSTPYNNINLHGHVNSNLCLSFTYSVRNQIPTTVGENCGLLGLRMPENNKDDLKKVQNEVNNSNVTIIGNNGMSSGSIINIEKSILNMKDTDYINSNINSNGIIGDKNKDIINTTKNLNLPVLYPLPNESVDKFRNAVNEMYSFMQVYDSQRLIIEKYDKELKENTKDSSLSKNSPDKSTSINFTNNIINNNGSNANLIDKSDINSKSCRSESLNYNKNNIDCPLNLKESDDQLLEKILQNPNSLSILNNIISLDENNSNGNSLINGQNQINTQLYSKYNNLIRKYWELIFQKKNNNKHQIKFPIDDKELYSFPDLYGITKESINKPHGNIIEKIPQECFSDLIQIYDFIQTFSADIQLSKFQLYELYVALKLSNTKYDKSINLINEIVISLLGVLLTKLEKIELSDLSSLYDDDLTLLKLILNNITEEQDRKSFLNKTWVEILRILICSVSYNIGDIKTKHKELLSKIQSGLTLEKFYKDITYNEKIIILLGLISSCYETEYIRDIIKSDQEKRNEILKNKKEIEDEIKTNDVKKKELERQEKFIQPQIKIDEITKKLNTLSEDNPNLPRNQLYKMRKDLEQERDEFKKVIKELEGIEGKRQDLFLKIEKIQNDIYELPTLTQKFVGVDGKGNKYFFFGWEKERIFIRYKNKSDNKYQGVKYLWNELTEESQIKELIEKLSEKGINENSLKYALKKIFPKKMSFYKETHKFGKKDKDKKDIQPMDIEDETLHTNAIESEGDVFIKAINYINTLNIKPKKSTKKHNKHQILYNNNQAINNQDGLNEENTLISIEKQENIDVSQKLLSIEELITDYLSIDNKEWESFEIRNNVRAWVQCIGKVNQYVNLLLFFNERLKSPYKCSLGGNNTLNKPAQVKKKIINDEDDMELLEFSSSQYSPIDVTGNLNYNSINPNLELGNKTRLWSKETEIYSVEMIYLNYLKRNNNLSMVYLSINLFEGIILDLSKRRDFYKRKNDDISIDTEDKGNEKNKKLNKYKEEYNIENDNENYDKNELKDENYEIQGEENSDFDENKYTSKLRKKNNKINYNENNTSYIVSSNEKKKENNVKINRKWNKRCMKCNEYGTLMHCEDCGNSCHSGCAGFEKMPEKWRCEDCMYNLANRRITRNSGKFY